MREPEPAVEFRSPQLQSILTRLNSWINFFLISFLVYDCIAMRRLYCHCDYAAQWREWRVL